VGLEVVQVAGDRPAGVVQVGQAGPAALGPLDQLGQQLPGGILVRGQRDTLFRGQVGQALAVPEPGPLPDLLRAGRAPLQPPAGGIDVADDPRPDEVGHGEIPPEWGVRRGRGP
jgi:hypothetical protein